MTEDEARTKWCPAFRGNDYGVNRPLEMTSASLGYCLGSGCMAWRTSHTVRGPVIERRRAEPMSSKPDGDDWGYEAVNPTTASAGGDWVRWATGETHGFCGLAGDPQ